MEPKVVRITEKQVEFKETHKKTKKVYNKVINKDLNVSSSSDSKDDSIKSNSIDNKSCKGQTINLLGEINSNMDFKKINCDLQIDEKNIFTPKYYKKIKHETKFSEGILKENSYFKSRKSSSNSNIIKIYEENKKRPSSLNIDNNQISSNQLVMKYVEDNRVNKFFDNLDLIGKGGYGLVIKARHIFDDKFWAIKVVKLNISNKRDLSDHPVIKEVKTMIKLDHENVVRYVTCWFQVSLNGIEDKLISMQTPSGIQTNTEGCVTNFHNTHKHKRKTEGRNINNVNIVNINKELDEFESSNSKISQTNDNSCGGILFVQPANRKYSSSSNKKKNIESMSTSFNNQNNSNIIPSNENFEVIDEETDTNNTHCTNTGQIENNLDIINIWDDEEDQEEQQIEQKVNEQIDPQISQIELSKEKPELSNIKKSSSDSDYTTLYFFMQMEFCDGLPLDKYLKSQVDTGISRQIIFSFLNQILIGVSHMHKSKIIHRDLKYFFYLDLPTYLSTMNLR